MLFFVLLAFYLKLSTRRHVMGASIARRAKGGIPGLLGAGRQVLGPVSPPNICVTSPRTERVPSKHICMCNSHSRPAGI